MSFAHAGGMSSMLKDGAKQMSGLEEAVLKNVRLFLLAEFPRTTYVITSLTVDDCARSRRARNSR